MGIADIFFGKPDTSIFFEGLPDKGRRRASTRNEFLRTKIAALEIRKTQAVNDANANRDVGKNYALYHISLIEIGLCKSKLADAAEPTKYGLAKVQSDARKAMRKVRFNSPGWIAFLSMAKESALIRCYLPSVFDGQLQAEIQEDHDADAKEKARVAKLRQDDAPKIALIESLRTIISDAWKAGLKSDNSAERIGCLYRMEAAQSEIRKLKRQLNISIPDAYEDEQRTG